MSTTTHRATTRQGRFALACANRAVDDIRPAIDIAFPNAESRVTGCIAQSTRKQRSSTSPYDETRFGDVTSGDVADAVRRKSNAAFRDALTGLSPNALLPKHVEVKSEPGRAPQLVVMKSIIAVSQVLALMMLYGKSLQ